MSSNEIASSSPPMPIAGVQLLVVEGRGVTVKGRHLQFFPLVRVLLGESGVMFPKNIFKIRNLRLAKIYFPA